MNVIGSESTGKNPVCLGGLEGGMMNCLSGGKKGRFLSSFALRGSYVEGKKRGKKAASFFSPFVGSGLENVDARNGGRGGA